MKRVSLFPLVLVLTVGLAFCQDMIVTIHDSSGNTTYGSIYAGSVYFQDGNGSMTFGTIRDGNVYLTGNNGETVFGTVKDGNVFLTDDHGVTTGTIRNGLIFLNNSDGSTTTGTYHTSGEATASQSQTSGDYEEIQKRQQEQQQRNYEAGYSLGYGVGSVIGNVIANHHINSFCKANPSGTYTANGVSTLCPEAPLDASLQNQADDYCRDNPGSWIAFGKHRVDCFTPPKPLTLKWAKFELDGWRWNYKNPGKAKLSISADEMAANWAYWRQTVCWLDPDATYKGLQGKKQHCH